MLPFDLLSYARPSRYKLCDDTGTDLTLTQGEGGEQGDPLMPLLFWLGIHGSLERVAASSREGECVLAYVDDAYAVAEPERIGDIYGMLRSRFAGGHGAFPLIGTPDDVLEGLKAISNAGLGGTTVAFVNYVDEFPYFRDEVIPRMEAAGLREPYKTDRVA